MVMQRKNKGFTLVELSIVLVIIGLLVGGVLVGRDLIRAAELQKVLSEVSAYQAAVNSFYTKYNAIPGDMNNATQHWGALGDCMVEEDSTATCNGNGNEKVGDSGTEGVLFWKHLVNANMVTANVTGVPDGVTTIAVTGATQNVPESAGVPGAGYMVMHLATMGDTDDTFAGEYNHSFVFGGTNAMGFNITPVMPPEDAYYIDSKRDDGLPGTGMVRTFKGDGDATMLPGCAVDSGDGYRYATATADLTCVLLFSNVF